MRVVFDSNILISALTLPGGQADRALRLVLTGSVTLVLSKAILEEVIRVLGTKFARDTEELARVAVFLGELAQWPQPRSRISILKDEPDNRILECAVDGTAALIVTGDRAMLALGEYEAVRIISLRAFLESAGEAL
jgi:putative PIN family toxin of toxin-antitoxin system